MIFEKTIINTYRFVEIEALKNGHTMLIDLTCLETMQMYKPNDEQKIKTQRKNFVLKKTLKYLRSAGGENDCYIKCFTTKTQHIIYRLKVNLSILYLSHNLPISL